MPPGPDPLLYDPQDAAAVHGYPSMASPSSCCCCRKLHFKPREPRLGMTRNYKTYLVLIFIPYLFLILIFHTQLQGYDHGKKVIEEEVAFRGRDHQQEEPFITRDLLKQSSALKYQKKELHNGVEFAPVDMHGEKSDQILGDSEQFSDDEIEMEARNNNMNESLGESDPKWNQIPGEIESLPQQGAILQQNSIPLHNPYFGLKINQSHNSAWNSTYPISAKCKDAPITRAVPYVQFQPLLSHWVYTAYHDDRGSKPTVRVILLIKKIHKGAFFCHFPLNNHPAEADDFITVIPSFYEMCENHAKDYGGWFMSCDVPSTLKRPPCEVVVATHSSYHPGHSRAVRVPVFTLSSGEKEQFGVCIPPIFGHIPSTTLIEFIEMTKLLGASHMVFYAHRTSREIQKVLQYYHEQDIITAIHWDLPVTDKHIWYHGQLLALNDCLYRNMHRFQYLSFNDLDEFIVPHSPAAHNWTDMISAIHKSAAASPEDNSTKYCGFSFVSTFFDPLSSGTRVLYDLESDLRTKSFSLVRTKCMVIPERMFELGIHHMSRPIKDIYKPFYVQPSIAYIHHYRKCVTDFDPKMNCQVFARDESLSPFIPSLRHNVHQRMWTLKELQKKQGWDHMNMYELGSL